LTRELLPADASPTGNDRRSQQVGDDRTRAQAALDATGWRRPTPRTTAISARKCGGKRCVSSKFLMKVPQPAKVSNNETDWLKQKTV
jgi:hypothetical protein